MHMNGYGRPNQNNYGQKNNRNYTTYPDYRNDVSPYTGRGNDHGKFGNGIRNGRQAEQGNYYNGREKSRRNNHFSYGGMNRTLASL